MNHQTGHTTKGNAMDDIESHDSTTRHLRLIEGVPAPLSTREAHTVSKEISALPVHPVSPARLQQLWAGANPTEGEIASLEAWSDYCARETQRLRGDTDRLRAITWRVIAATLILWMVVAVIYLVTHAHEVMNQLSGI